MDYQLNDRIFLYESNLEYKYTRTFGNEYYDVVTKTVLFYTVESSTHSNEFLGIDFWRDAPRR